MSINQNDLTDEEKYFLLEISYIDVNTRAFKRTNDYFIEQLLLTAKWDEEISKDQRKKVDGLIEKFNRLTEKNPSLKDIKLIGYENRNVQGETTHNDQSGFVGYALEDGEGNRGFLFRGSEMESWKDWTDNASSGMTGTSLQVEQAKAFFEAYSTDEHREPLQDVSYSLYGHSKGNNLAAEVFVSNLDKDIYAYSVNGQPIYWYDLTAEQKAALRGERYTFIVHEGDIVSGLGYVDYVDTVVHVRPKKWNNLDPMYPHKIAIVDFDENGDFKSTQPPDWWQRQIYNGVVTLGKAWGGVELRNRREDPFGFGAWKEAGKDIGHYLVDTVKLIWKHEVVDPFNRVKEQCVEAFGQLTQWSSERLTELKRWLSAVGEGIKRVSGILAGWFKSGAAITGMGLPLPALNVNIDELRRLANRLQAVQNRIAQVDHRMDRLTDVVMIDERPVTLWYGFRVAHDDDLQRCIHFLNEAANRYEQCELEIQNHASSFV